MSDKDERCLPLYAAQPAPVLLGVPDEMTPSRISRRYCCIDTEWSQQNDNHRHKSHPPG